MCYLLSHKNSEACDSVLVATIVSLTPQNFAHPRIGIINDGKVERWMSSSDMMFIRSFMKIPIYSNLFGGKANTWAW